MGNRDDIQRAQAGRATWNMWARGHRKNGTTYDVDFSGEIITKRMFKGFIFPGKVNFSGARFPSKVSFRDAQFWGDANFAAATFLASQYLAERASKAGEVWRARSSDAD
jgi:pentapeptide repeat protein